MWKAASCQPIRLERADRCRPSLLRRHLARPRLHRRKSGEPMGLAEWLYFGGRGERRVHGGLRYGEGRLYTKNAGDLHVFWQGPSLGFDAGADGARTMMLVYNLPRMEGIFDRIRRYRGLCLFRRRPRHDGADGQRYCRGADPFRSRAAARSQHWLSQIHGAPDLEPVLTSSPVVSRAGYGAP